MLVWAWPAVGSTGPHPTVSHHSFVRKAKMSLNNHFIDGICHERGQSMINYSSKQLRHSKKVDLGPPFFTGLSLKWQSQGQATQALTKS